MRVAFIARQPGTAHVFGNWLIHLKREKAAWLTDVFIYPEAAGHVEGKIVVTEDELFRKLGESRPDCLVTGTSLSVEQDATHWQWAQASGIPCMAVAESWVNLPERFRLHGVRWSPDLIAVPDSSAASVLREAGFEAGKIREIGNPLLDQAMLLRKEGRGGDRILFVTEPPLPEMGESLFRNKFHQLDSDLFVHLMYALQSDPAIKARLTVRLHPRDSRQTWLQRVRGSQQSQQGSTGPVDEAEPGFHWDQESKSDSLRRAAVVVGLGSMLLHEAAVSGRPVMALRMSDEEPFPELISRPGVYRVKVQTNIFAHLKALLGQSRLVSSNDAGQATPSYIRLIDIIEELVNE